MYSHFVDVCPPTASEHEKELAKANARSHAAKIAHSRRKRHDHRNPQSRPSRRDSSGSLNETDAVSEITRQDTSSRLLLRAWRGNGDPFNVVGAVSITPRVIEVIVFTKMHYTRGPLTDRPHTTFLLAAIVEGHVEDSYQTSIATLQQRYLANVYLYSIMNCMAMISAEPKLHVERMEVKQRALDDLRLAMLAGSCHKETVREIVESLFGAAVVAYDLKEAMIHGKALESMMSHQLTQRESGRINTTIIAGLLWKDGILAEHRLCEQIFDTQKWESVLLAFRLNGGQQDLTSLNCIPMDPFITTNGLTSMFQYARQCLPAYSRPGHVHHPSQIHPWTYTAGILAQCRANAIMLAIYPTLDLDTEVLSAKDITKLVKAGLCAACLLFIYLYRLKADQFFHPGPPATLERLRNIVRKLQSLRESAFATELHHVGTSIIWMCFLGATVEAETMTRWTSKAAIPIFNACLRDTAVRIGINPYSRCEVERVLARFVYPSRRSLPLDDGHPTVLDSCKKATVGGGTPVPMNANMVSIHATSTSNSTSNQSR